MYYQKNQLWYPLSVAVVEGGYDGRVVLHPVEWLRRHFGGVVNATAC